MTKSFTHFVGIDWSGAKGKRHAGLAVAICDADGHVSLAYAPDGKPDWSRKTIAGWLSQGCGLPSGSKVLAGIDAAFGYPYVESGAYLRGGLKADCAPGLWQEIANICSDEVDYYGGAFIENYSKHYRRQSYNSKTKRFDTLVDKDFFQPLLRKCEQICIDEKYGPCESVFNLIGASQVGKSALSTMNMLHELQSCEHINIWPFEMAFGKQVTVVEIYAAIFAKLGGNQGKIRDFPRLNATLKGLGAQPYQGELPRKIDDATDALITAAGLRAISSNVEYWNPPRLSSMVRRTEGWIFGVK